MVNMTFEAFKAIVKKSFGGVILDNEVENEKYLKIIFEQPTIKEEANSVSTDVQMKNFTNRLKEISDNIRGYKFQNFHHYVLSLYKILNYKVTKDFEKMFPLYTVINNHTIEVKEEKAEVETPVEVVESKEELIKAAEKTFGISAEEVKEKTPVESKKNEASKESILSKVMDSITKVAAAKADTTVLDGNEPKFEDVVVDSEPVATEEVVANYDPTATTQSPIVNTVNNTAINNPQRVVLKYDCVESNYGLLFNMTIEETDKITTRINNIFADAGINNAISEFLRQAGYNAVPKFKMTNCNKERCSFVLLSEGIDAFNTVIRIDAYDNGTSAVRRYSQPQKCGCGHNHY